MIAARTRGAISHTWSHRVHNLAWYDHASRFRVGDHSEERAMRSTPSEILSFDIGLVRMLMRML